jgi:voltage-gated sodium channel
MTKTLQSIVDSDVFKSSMILIILLAAVVVGLETDSGIMEEHGALLHLIDKVILVLFVVELVIRLGACGPRYGDFFKNGWNVFDFIIVAICLLPLQSEFAAVLRLARVLRLMRLITALPRLQLLVGALLKSFSSMGYVGTLLLLLFYIYGVIGVFLFGKTDVQHFGGLGRAMMTLFQIVTLEGWVEIMRGLMPADGVSLPVVAYFVSFILLGTMIMLNLFIGVIMNGMTEMQAEAAAANPATGNLIKLETENSALRDEIKLLKESKTP